MNSIHNVRDLVTALLGLNPEAKVHFLLEGDLIPLGEVRADDDETSIFICPEERPSPAKEYLVRLREAQSCSREGLRRVRASCADEALKMVQLDHDDNQTQWESWEDDASEIVIVSAKETV